VASVIEGVRVHNLFSGCTVHFACGKSGTVVVLSSESQGKDSNVPSDWSLVVDEERMSPGHWLASVICVSFIAFDTVGWVTGRTTDL